MGLGERGGLLALALIAGCGSDGLTPCPNTHALGADQVCRLKCQVDDQCFASERCSNELLCVPRPDMGPEIVYFSANPTLVEEGRSVRFEYAALHADRVTIREASAEPFEVSQRLVGEVDHLVSATASYVLEAWRGDQKVERSLQVEVTPAVRVRILSFTANPNAVRAGENVTLEWVVENATSRRVTDEQGRELPLLSDFKAVDNPITNTTYRLTAEGPGGPVFQEVMVQVVIDPIELRIDRAELAAPSKARPGDNAVISWETTGASSVKVRDLTEGRDLYTSAVQAVAAKGRWLVMLPEPGERRFEVVVEGQGTSARQEVSVQVTPYTDPPLLRGVSITPEIGNRNENVVVGWDVLPVDTPVTLTDLVSGVATAYNGPDTAAFQPEGETRRFLLRAENEGGADEVYLTSWVPVDARGREPNDNLQQAIELPGLAAETAIDSEADVDHFAFDVPPGGQVRARLQGVCLSPVTFSILDGQGTALATESSVVLSCPNPIDLTRLAGGRYYVAISAELLVPEDYTLLLDVRPPECGDGRVDPGEACDDNNMSTRDGCSPTCQLEPAFHIGARVVVPDPQEPVLTPLSFDLVPPFPGAEVADQGVGVVTLPFEFPFYGHTYRGLMVHVDGFVGFTPVLPTVSVLTSGAPDAVIAPFAQDLRIRGNGGIFAASFPAGAGLEGIGIIFDRVGLQVSPASELSASVGLLSDGRMAIRYRSLLGAPARTVEAGLESPDGGRFVVPVPCANGTPGVPTCALSGLPDGQMVELFPGTGQ